MRIVYLIFISVTGFFGLFFTGVFLFSLATQAYKNSLLPFTLGICFGAAFWYFLRSYRKAVEGAKIAGASATDSPIDTEIREANLQGNWEYAGVSILLSLCLIVSYLFFSLVVGMGFLPDAANLYLIGGNFGFSSAHGEPWRLISAIFIHASPQHLLANVVGLVMVGKLINKYLGWKILLALFFMGGIGGSISSSWIHPELVSVGASGAIFSLYGALIAIFCLGSLYKVKTERVVIFSSIAYGILALSGGLGKTGIDNAAHVGGLLTGFFLIAAGYQKKNSSPNLTRIFSSGAVTLSLLAFVFLPKFIPVNKWNPGVDIRFQKIVFAMESLDMEFLKKEAKIAEMGRKYSREDHAIVRQWILSEYLPEYEKNVKELLTIQPSGSAMGKIKELLERTGSQCTEYARKIASIPDFNFKDGANGIDEARNNCADAILERYTLSEQIMKELEKK